MTRQEIGVSSGSMTRLGKTRGLESSISMTRPEIESSRRMTTLL